MQLYNTNVLRKKGAMTSLQDDSISYNTHLTNCRTLYMDIGEKFATENWSSIAELI